MKRSAETEQVVERLRERAEGKAGAVAHGVGDRRDELIAEAALYSEAANTIEAAEQRTKPVEALVEAAREVLKDRRPATARIHLKRALQPFTSEEAE